MKMTFNELVKRMEAKGNNLADVAVGRMMDIIEDETGNYPRWTDIAPEWVVKNCIGDQNTGSVEKLGTYLGKKLKIKMQ